jgi:hypothetical protein
VKEKAISDESARMLRQIAHMLDAHAKGKDLSPVQARAASHVIRRILEAPQGIKRFSNAQQLEMAIALAYRYRKELEDGKRQGLARSETATANDISVHLVSKYAKIWKRHVDARMAQIEASASSSIERDNLLRRELEELKTRKPRKSRDRKRAKSVRR